MKVIIVVVQVGAVKIYVAAVEALRKKERGGSKQHETQGNYSSCTGRSSENLCSSSLFDISMKRTCQVCQHWKQPLFPLEVVEKTIIFQVLDSCCSVQKIWLMTHHCMIRSSCSIHSTLHKCASLLSLSFLSTPALSPDVIPKPDPGSVGGKVVCSKLF